MIIQLRFEDGLGQDLVDDMRPKRDEHLRELIDKLPASERHLIEMLFFEQTSLLEAAKRLKVSESTVRHLREEAFRHVKEMLEEGG
jgi:RNA polymerase sigma factor (sigma-70 family)